MSRFARFSRAVTGQASEGRGIASTSLTLLSLRVVGLILGLAGNILLARLLGVEDYGYWAVIMAGIALLVIPASFGLPTLLVREVAKARAGEDWAALNGVYHWSLRVALITSLAVVMVGGGLVLVLPIRQVLSPLLLAVVLLMIPIRAIAPVLEGFLRGLKRVVPSFLPGLFANRVVFVGFLAAYYFYWPGRFSLSTAILLQAGVAALALSLLVGLKYRDAAALPSMEPNLSQRKVWRNAALALVATQALFELHAQVDKLMIGALSSTEQVSFYSGAQRWAGLLGFLMITVNLVLGPVFAELLAKEDKRGVEALARSAVFAVFGLGLFAAVVYWLWGVALLRLFGAEFIAGETALRLLTVGQLVNLAAGSVGLLLVMANGERFVTAAVGASTVLNVLLNLVLVQRFGATGAAVATSVSMVFWNLLLLVAVRRFLGINPSILGGPRCLG